MSATVAAADAKLVPWFTGWQAPLGSIQPMALQAPQQPKLAEGGVVSADCHLPYAPAVPGSHRAGPCDPGGAPYGRRPLRRHRTAFPGVGKGLGIGCSHSLGSMLGSAIWEFTVLIKPSR